MSYNPTKPADGSAVIASDLRANFLAIASAHAGGSAPSAAIRTTGMKWYDTTSRRYKYWSGTEWLFETDQTGQTIVPGVSSPTPITLFGWDNTFVTGTNKVPGFNVANTTVSTIQITGANTDGRKAIDITYDNPIDPGQGNGYIYHRVQLKPNLEHAVSTYLKMTAGTTISLIVKDHEDNILVSQNYDNTAWTFKRLQFTTPDSVTGVTCSVEIHALPGYTVSLDDFSIHEGDVTPSAKPVVSIPKFYDNATLKDLDLNPIVVPGIFTMSTVAGATFATETINLGNKVKIINATSNLKTQTTDIGNIIIDKAGYNNAEDGNLDITVLPSGANFGDTAVITLSFIAIAYPGTMA